jgi:hypothetical protein
MAWGRQVLQADALQIARPLAARIALNVNA